MKKSWLNNTYSFLFIFILLRLIKCQQNDTIIDTTTFSGIKCPEITWNGIRFPETDACTEAVVPCPNSEEVDGFIRFQCGCEHGTWMNKVDMSNCTHVWINDIKNLIKNNENSILIANKMLNNVQTTVAENNLYSGDIINIVDISEELLPLADIQIKNIGDMKLQQYYAYNFTELFGKNGDELLSENAVKAWNGLNNNIKFNKINILMKLLEESLLLISDYMSTIQLNYNNWASKIITNNNYISTLNNNIESDAVKTIKVTKTRDKSYTRPFRTYGSSTIIEFDKFQNSPIMELPNIDILSSYMNSNANNNNIMANPMLATSNNANNNDGNIEKHTSTKLGTFIYNSLGDVLKMNETSIINSNIIGAFINDPTESINLPKNNFVNFTFYHIKVTNVMNPRCVYWDIKNNIWSTNGCKLIETNNHYTKCSCIHLTSFAILMDLNSNINNLIYDNNYIALEMITKIGCTLSALCLFLSIIIFLFFKTLYNVRHAIHINLCLCLLISELLFVLGINRAQHYITCRGIAIALHYFFLSSFSWMLLEGYQLYMMLIQVFEPNKSRIYLYYLIGYIIPAIIVAISAGITYYNYGTLTYCWINVNTSTIWAFIIPVIVIIISNIIILLIALKVVLSVKSRDRTTMQKVFGWLKGSAMLLCLLGITWIFGFLTAIPKASIVFAYIFTILNTLQGMFIFIFHVILNDKIRVLLIKTIRQGILWNYYDENNKGNQTTNTTTFLSKPKQKLLKFFNKNDTNNSVNNNNNPSDYMNQQQHENEIENNLYNKNLNLSTMLNKNDIKFQNNNDKDDYSTNNHDIDDNDDDSINEINNIPDRPIINVSGSNISSNIFDNDDNINYTNDLLRIDSLSFNNRHSAPVKRKKFPLGSTNEERSAELHGRNQNTHQKTNIIVEKF